MGVESKKETTVQLNDIRKKLSELDDKELALDILDFLDSKEVMLAEKVAIIAQMEEKETELLRQNSRLFGKVSEFNDKPAPDSEVNYSEMDNLTNLLDKI